MNDEYYMKRAIELARKAVGHTSPNPLVGSVIVKNGKIIGEGYHAQFGGKHAEIVAIESATEPVEGATLYCNLEPCCHDIPEKKTPPCAPRLIREKIKRVVIANRDPNHHVNGQGIRMLRNAGIEVKTDVLAAKAALLNETYYKFIQSHQPFVHLKIAQSLDGRIATANGHSHWITNSTARKLVHQWRAEYDAVLVGTKTVLKDNPSLTVRDVPGRNPRRIVLDDQLVIPDQAHLISDELADKTILFTAKPESDARARQLRKRGVQVLQAPTDDAGHLDIRVILQKLAEMEIASLLVEGGGEVFTSFVKQRIFDKISIFIAPMIIGAGVESIGSLGISSLSEALRLQKIRIEIIDGQALVQGYRNFTEIFTRNLKEN